MHCLEESKFIKQIYCQYELLGAYPSELSIYTVN